MNRQGGVTIKDVARAAQVSVATVSRALNGHHNVTPDVRRRVEAAAAQLRYVPHAAARSLSSRRTQTLGVVLPDLHGEYFSELLRGIDQVARAAGLHLLVSSYQGHPEAQGAALRTLRGRVDGLLVMSPFAGLLPAPETGDHATLPMVLINSPAAPGSDALCIDNEAGARAMVGHLLACGHRRIAFIAGPEGNFDAGGRLRGYREALAAAGPGLDEWVLPGDFTLAAGHRAAGELLAATPRPDAVFAAHDLMALGCLFGLAQAGVRVPEDIALAGFDDIPLASYMHPALTTIRVNIAELGERAARLLIARIAGTDAAAVPAPFIPELIVRDSSGKRALAGD